jgi:hypothetical protein
MLLPQGTEFLLRGDERVLRALPLRRPRHLLRGDGGVVARGGQFGLGVVDALALSGGVLVERPLGVAVRALGLLHVGVALAARAEFGRACPLHDGAQGVVGYAAGAVNRASLALFFKSAAILCAGAVSGSCRP